MNFQSHGNWGLYYVTEADNMLPQRRGDADEERHFSRFNPDLRPPGAGGGLTAATSHNHRWAKCFIRIMQWLFYMIVLLWRIHNSSSLFFMPFMQHHMCLSPRIRMETSLWRYCKPSKRGLQGGITHSPELLQLHNMLGLDFSAPLIYQSNDSANRLRILVPVSRIYQARLLVSLAINVLAETQNGEHVAWWPQAFIDHLALKPSRGTPN